MGKTKCLLFICILLCSLFDLSAKEITLEKMGLKSHSKQSALEQDVKDYSFAEAYLQGINSGRLSSKAKEVLSKHGDFTRKLHVFINETKTSSDIELKFLGTVLSLDVSLGEMAGDNLASFDIKYSDFYHVSQLIDKLALEMQNFEKKYANVIDKWVK